MLEEDKPLQRQSLGGIGIYNYEYVPSTSDYEKDYLFDQRKSEEPNHVNISHTCKCYTDCEW